ncbi:hypothetical protein SteCoe_15288 [Stentor coeruleus]|uniref:C2 domain-containing protein n=1 Tax=Stentor coeruleus TaxID=5963 RepID=A0A1R2C415_9CILI|nr:hypothetical protein SteCoe_15288 [Stentor coeruleus]
MAEPEKKKSKDEKETLKMKKGDYQVHIFLEETRGLVPEDECGTIDPLVILKVFNTRKYTDPKDDLAAGSAVHWGDHFFFTAQNLEVEEIESTKILIEVRNHRALLKDSLIGCYELDATYVYFQNNHSLIHKWIALCNPESENYQKIRGHVKLGVSVLGEGDDDVNLTSADSDNADDLEILLPPQISLKPYQLIVSIIKAENLPKMDAIGTINAYCQVQFGGAKKKTSVKDADNVRFSVSWYEDIFLPVMMPNVSSRLVIKVMDQDKTSKNDTVGCLTFDFKSIEKGDFSEYFWTDIYGAPPDTGNRHAKTMNSVPEAASVWHGRILLKIKLEQVPKPIHDCAKIQDPNIVEYIQNSYENTNEFEIRCQIYSGVALTTKYNEFSIEVCWCQANQEGPLVKAINRKCNWYESLKTKILKVPNGTKTLGDIFIYLRNKDNVRICYTRLRPEDFCNPKAGPRWVTLMPDRAISEVSNDWEAGYIQLRLYSGVYTGNEDPKIGKWHLRPMMTPEKKIKKAQLYFNLYQCRDLPAADSDGQSDPYVEIYCNGTTCKSEVIENTLNPMWYVVIEMEVELASSSDSPPIIVHIKDKDITSNDDLIGTCTYYVSEAEQDSEIPAKPIWRDLTLGKTFGGKILASMNIYMSMKPPKPIYNIEPECVEATAEINCLGLRDLCPAVGWLPVNKSFIKFDLNSIQMPSEKISITNVKTQPGETGPNPTINAVVQFNFLMPVDRIFCPVLTCVVYDFLFKGLSQPQIGVFNIDLSKGYDVKPKKKTPYIGTLGGPSSSESSVSSQDKNESDKNIENPSESQSSIVVINNKGKLAVEAARRGEFMIRPAFTTDLFGRKKEISRPDENYMRLGYEREYVENVLHYRYMVNCELEKTEYIDASPFESYIIRKGLEKDEDSWLTSLFSRKTEEVVNPMTTKQVGIFKGIARVSQQKNFEKIKNTINNLKEKRKVEDSSAVFYDNEDEDFDDIRKLLLKKTELVVRVYVISCENLAQKDVKSHSDPYIKIKLSGKVINDSKNYQQDQPNPKFLKHFDMLTVLPGASRLKIQVWDKDDLFKDDKIGETIIDLEDRYFSNKWRRLPEKPIEKRQLKHKSSKLSQGSIVLWVEIHEPSALPAPLDITEKPPEEYEARLIIWQTDGVESYDVEETSDIYIRAIVNDSKPKETDTHYRCQNGQGQFNWRMKFPITLPSEDCRVTLQIWDRDVFTPSDFIGDATFKFSQLARECFETDKRIKMRGGKDSLLSDLSKEDGEKFWIPCQKPKEKSESGETEDAGRIKISFELVPKRLVEACPVGEGREEPNVDPFLPGPTGRFQWSWNPCKLISQTCGPGFRLKICCALCCALCIYLAIMIAPSLIGASLGNAI